MSKRRTKTPTTDRAAIAAKLDLRRQQHADATQQRTGAIAARDEAQTRRDALRLSALADGDVAARSAYLQASTTYRSAADLADETTALVGQLADEIAQLEAAHLAARQDEVRDLNRADGLHAVAACRAMDEAAAALVAAYTDLRKVRLRQAERAAGVLPESEMARFDNYRCTQPLRWTMRALDLSDPGRLPHHSFREVSCAEIEQGVQGDVAMLEPITDAADVPALIDAAEMVA